MNGQIHEHLLELSRIGHDVPESGIERDVEIDVGAKQAAKHLIQVGNGAVEGQDLRLEHLPPAEGEQLAGECRGAMAGVADLLDVGADGIALFQLLEHEVAVAQDTGQQVVEVVGDAARELSHRLHSLRLATLVLAPAERRLRLFALYREANQVAGHLNDPRVVQSGRARFAVEERDRSQHRLVGRKERRNPRRGR